MYRTPILILLVLTFGLSSSLAQDGGQVLCLQYDDQYTSRTIINLATGEKRGGEAGAAIASSASRDSYAPIVMVSPDQQHTAVEYQTASGEVIFALLPAYDTEATLDLTNDANDGLRHYNMNWSPDSQWFSYLTFHENDGYYLSLMDTAGNVTQTRLISTRFEDSVSSFGWSGDSRYLAVSVSDSYGGPLRKIEIWSVPNLDVARLVLPKFSRGGPRQFIGDAGIPEEMQYPDRIQWGSEGSVLAYLSYIDDGMNDNRLTLNFYTPDDDQTTTYDLANNRYEAGIGMAWSPDGQSVAIASTDYDYSSLTGRVEVVSLNDTEVDTVSEKVMHYQLLADGGPGFPLMHWSADGHALFFVEQPPKFSRTLGALMAYLPSSGETIELAPHVYMNPHLDTSHRYLFALSPDDGQDHNRYLNRDALEQTPTTEDSIIVMDTQTLQVQSVPALQNKPDFFQVNGNYSDISGWLTLYEDGWLTQAINIRTDDHIALYPPHFIDNPVNKVPIYYPIANSDFLAEFDSQSPSPSNLTIVSLEDGSRRTIPNLFSTPLNGLFLSPNQEYIAKLTGVDFQGVILEIIKADGTLLWYFDHLDVSVHNFVFVTCE